MIETSDLHLQDVLKAENGEFAPELFHSRFILLESIELQCLTHVSYIFILLQCYLGFQMSIMVSQLFDVVEVDKAYEQN